MADYWIILITIAVFSIGRGNQGSRELIAGGLVISSAVSLISVYSGVIEWLDPGLFGFNCFLAITLAFAVFFCESELQAHIMASYVVTGLYTYFSFTEYYAGSSIMYSFYSEAMILITLWQLLLMARLGHAQGNIGKWFVGHNPYGFDGGGSRDSGVSFGQADKLRAADK